MSISMTSHTPITGASISLQLFQIIASVVLNFISSYLFRFRPKKFFKKGKKKPYSYFRYLFSHCFFLLPFFTSYAWLSVLMILPWLFIIIWYQDCSRGVQARNSQVQRGSRLPALVQTTIGCSSSSASIFKGS